MVTTRYTQWDGTQQLKLDADKAFEWIERAIAERDPGVSYLRMDPFLREIRDDPRWLPLLRKLKLVE